VRLANEEEVTGLRIMVERTRAQYVALDTWHRMTPGIEENSATETGGPLDKVLQLRDDYGATVLLAHHTGHQQLHARGSSALEDDADASWLVRLGKDDSAEDRSAATPRTLLHRKSKDGELLEPQSLRLEVDDQGGAVVTVDPFTVPATAGKPGRPSAEEKHKAAVLQLIADLDADGIPARTGYREILEWDAIRRPGETASQRAAKDAAATRKARALATESAASLASPPKGGGDATQDARVSQKPSPEVSDPRLPAEMALPAPESKTPPRVSDSGESKTPPRVSDSACPNCGSPTRPVLRGMDEVGRACTRCMWRHEREPGAA
jgi:hypothetical protein